MLKLSRVHREKIHEIEIYAYRFQLQMKMTQNGIKKLWSENKKFLPWISCGRSMWKNQFISFIFLLFYIFLFVAVFLVNGNQSIWFKWKILEKLGGLERKIHAKKYNNKLNFNQWKTLQFSWKSCFKKSPSKQSGWVIILKRQ